MSRRTLITSVLHLVDAAFVAAVAYLCWTLVWCEGPFEGMGWLFPAFFVGPPLTLIGLVYFLISAGRHRDVMVPLAAIAVVAAVSVLAIGTGIVQKLRWLHARPAVLAVADYPPARQTTEQRRIGTYNATVHTNTDGTVFIAFTDSWDGLLYVPPGQPEPDRQRQLSVGPEIMPRWWYYDTD